MVSQQAYRPAQPAQLTKTKTPLTGRLRVAVPTLGTSSGTKANQRVGVPLEHLGAVDGSCQDYLGITTVSMTWMTPLLVTISVFTTLALLTLTPPAVVTVRLLPCTVLTEPALTSAAMTLPGTT